MHAMPRRHHVCFELTPRLLPLNVFEIWNAPRYLEQAHNVGVERSEMTARAGRDPAAERRTLEALWKMTKRKSVLLEPLFKSGANSKRVYSRLRPPPWEA
jgi:hypothetical protein